MKKRTKFVCAVEAFAMILFAIPIFGVHANAEQEILKNNSVTRVEQAYIDLTEEYIDQNKEITIDYQSFVEEFSASKYDDVEDYELSLEAQIPQDKTIEVLDEEQISLVEELKKAETVKKAYNAVVSQINSEEISVDYNDFVKEYVLLGADNLEEYINAVRSMTQGQSKSGGKWYYNTGTSLPKSLSYTGTLMARVNKGDILYEANGGFGITGHLAIVEGVFYSKTYHQFYIRLIEAVSNTNGGVCRGILSNDRFSEKAGAILRPNNSSITGKKINNAIKFCIGQLGKSYGMDLAHDTSSNESDWYCSELVWAAYKNQGIELENVITPTYTNEPGVTPHDIRHSTTVDVVGVSNNEVTFSDITTHWAKNYILFVAKNGVMNGTTLVTFSPDSNLNRAMAITTIYKLAGTPTNIGNNSFSDVSQSSYYAVPVSWAVTHNITSGTSSTQFSPNNNVTREQLAVFLYKFASYFSLSTTYNNNALAGFSDASTISNYAVTAMKWAVSKSIISGTSSNTLSPKAVCTRAQLATILYALIHNLM